MHPEAYAYVEGTLASLKSLIRAGAVREWRSILDMGGRDVNGTIRDLLPADAAYISIDAVPGPNVDVIANAAVFGERESYDLVLCCEVLEHTPLGREICINAHRVLKPKGAFILTAATEGRPPHSMVDGGALRDDEHYRNIAPSELDQCLKRFFAVQMEINETAHDIYATAIKG